ncbi:MAG: hypothetical protein U1F11_08895 [Steroidobacteraceae bacterium]
MNRGRRALLAGLGALPLARFARSADDAPGPSPGDAPAPVPASTTTNAAATRIVPFAPGDVVAGCTLLDDAQDDHRGHGRILHWDASLRLRNTIWLDDTTHIVQGVRFGPDRTLWAFDAFAYRIVRIGADGRRRPNFRTAPARSFAHVTFAPDGRFFLGENFTGAASRVPLRTKLPFMPGTQRYGDGHLFEFSARGKLLREHATAVHGGMGGFQGLTASALAADGRTLFYTSESGPKVFRYDLLERRQLPDFLAFDEKQGRFFFDLAFDADGRLLIVDGQGIGAWSPGGQLLRNYPLGSFGWASMSTPRSGHVYVTNFFSGEIARLELASGEVTARAQAGIRKSLSGVAEFA